MGMEASGSNQHWFSFKDACVFALERASHEPTTPRIRQSLFFLHGRLGQSEIWTPLLDELSSQFHCVAIDFPGFGRSFVVKERGFALLEHAILVDALMRQFGASEKNKTILVGHEVGGVIAQLCALRHPEKVAAIILLNSALLTRDLQKIRIGFRGWLVRRKLNQMLGRSDGILPFSKDILLSPWESRVPRSLLLRSFEALDESWPKHYEKQSWKKEIQNLIHPVLLLWGGMDSISPPELGAEMVQKLPDAHFFVHEQAGHWPSLEQPQWVLTKMREFLFRVASGMIVRTAPFQKSLSR